MNARQVGPRPGERPFSGRGPIRTCIGCRKRDLDTHLLRVVLAPDGTHVVPDPRRCAPGRGAWVHPDMGCLTTARDRKAYGRALRVGGTVSSDMVPEALSGRLDSAPPHDGERREGTDHT